MVKPNRKRRPSRDTWLALNHYDGVTLPGFKNRRAVWRRLANGVCDNCQERIKDGRAAGESLERIVSSLPCRAEWSAISAARLARIKSESEFLDATFGKAIWTAEEGETEYGRRTREQREKGYAK